MPLTAGLWSTLVVRKRFPDQLPGVCLVELRGTRTPDPLLAKVDRFHLALGQTLVKLRVHVPRMTVSAPLVILVLARTWHGRDFPSMRTTGGSVACSRSGKSGRSFQA